MKNHHDFIQIHSDRAEGQAGANVKVRCLPARVSNPLGRPTSRRMCEAWNPGLIAHCSLLTAHLEQSPNREIHTALTCWADASRQGDRSHDRIRDHAEVER